MKRPGIDASRGGLLGGPLAAVALMVFADLDPAHRAATPMAAIGLWMAIWWLTEAVPLAVTALLPVVLYPVLGVMAGKAVAPVYFNWIIFLFLGGFMVALAMERWTLHRRIALRIITAIGGGPRRIVLGFMLATAFLSMWISNTATAMMMAPVAMAVIARLSDTLGVRRARRFGTALLLGVAYSASVGGLATLIGTPPNPLLVSNFELMFPGAPEISFAGWMVLGVPLAVVALAAIWVLVILLFRLGDPDLVVDHEVLHRERRELGPMSYEEKIVLADFTLMALLWLSRKGLVVGSLDLPGWSSLFAHGEMIDDGTVAMALAVILFLVPSRSEPGSRVMDWHTARKLPWGIVLLFGGGFALAKGFVDTGLSLWLGERMAGLSSMPVPLVVLAVCLVMTFLTELTSNTATTQMALPVLASLAVALHLNPLLLMVPATLSASCAFMLPVATPPNAIIFGTVQVTVRDMARAGFLLNLFCAVLITVAVYVLGPYAFGVDLHQVPAWASHLAAG
ncbi:sodium:dicarboxylate symporter [bacterium CG_4_9_14_3_um_filter_65_15]|nr:MAG: sodium:dicarboxylate symporter [bacterium CG_4_9_14_3_um_filter_65_15]